ncbi:PD-(D/E)XK nuclease family protein (plasmid) [Lysinibacillus capsici]|uniref:PD-(D/E)XK nuclease family protein n=1 Tax=Lysinibacillus capsici TaxID=2115968 RepID=UPI0021DAF60B|nr:PD-(D/E)XK nuclease family protein [Lysinibacillus capsici]UYB50115.1 PD-(D/E)XK nuclease family protein [Lysinibacillus capsici]
MEVILGYWLDGPTYPDEWTGVEASIGKQIKGFQGLVSLLEKHAGYEMLAASETTRIAEWQATMQQLDNGKKQYSKSFATDSWHTAQQLMQQRDELILAGWQPHLVDGSEWLKALSEIELAIANRTLGFADRVVRIFYLIEQNEMNVPIKTIFTVDPHEELLDVWMTQLLRLLREKGVQIVPYQASLHVENTMQSDLQKIKRALTENTPLEDVKLQNDGSFVIVHAEQEWDLIDFLASWLQVYGDDQTVIINRANNVMLAELLHRRGLPSSDVTIYSQARSVLQILPLVLETYWQPIRIDNFLQLLTLPTSPIHPLLASKLARTVAEEPGIGGEKWNQAIEEAVQQIHQSWQEDETYTPQKRTKKMEDLQEVLALYIQHPFYDVAGGIPIEVIENVAGHLARWANNRILNGGNIYISLKQMIDELISSLQALNVEKISQLQLMHIYHAVVGEGAKLSSYKVERAPWKVIRKPGALFNQVNQVLWWQMIDSGNAQKNRWTMREREYLKEHGIHLTTPQAIRKRQSNAWHSAIQFANERFICFIPAKVRGENVKAHPFVDELKFAVTMLGENLDMLRFDAKQLKQQPDNTTFKFVRQQVTYQQLPNAIRNWVIPNEHISLREKESATSLEKLLRCPLDWTLQYAAKIKATPTLSLPNESKMLGNLGHKILEYLINEGTLQKVEQIEERTGQLFRQFVPQMAAPLLLPEQQSNYRRVLIELQKSMRQFAHFVQQANISIVETEKLVNKTWQDQIELEGRLDLYAKTASNRPMIIDAKWSRHPKRYREMLAQGSVQLAIYHWLLAEQETDVFPIAYFMLATGDVYALNDDDVPQDKHVEGKNMPETLQLLREEIDLATEELRNGQAIALGVQANEEGRQANYEPNCRFCQYQQLCGAGGVLT